MGDLMNLARPDIWAMVEQNTTSAIGAELVDLEYEFRPGWNGASRDVYAVFVVLWSRPARFGVPGAKTWGTHRGCVRRKLAEDPYSHLFEGHYDQAEPDARNDYVERQVGLS